MATLKVPVGQDDHIQGNPKAPLTLVEYGDYECPACGLAYPIVKAVQKHFGRDLRFVFRNSPLAQMHPNAESAAETAEWAASHRRFWEMHDALYEIETMLGLPLYLSLANALQLSEEELSVALENRIFYPKVRADLPGGKEAWSKTAERVARIDDRVFLKNTTQDLRPGALWVSLKLSDRSLRGRAT